MRPRSQFRGNISIPPLTGPNASGSSPALPENETEGFALFFSGHVANIKIISEYFRNKREMRNAIILELLNAFQVVRILATRGHYSIDIITGYMVGFLISETGKCFNMKYGK